MNSTGIQERGVYESRHTNVFNAADYTHSCSTPSAYNDDKHDDRLVHVYLSLRDLW